MTYWHYTCDHGRAALGDAGIVHPAKYLTDRPMPWPGRFAWFTDMDTPQPAALGLTRILVSCDRTAHRYRVTDDTHLTPWSDFARNLPRAVRDELELEPGARPRHWWVALLGVPVEYAP